MTVKCAPELSTYENSRREAEGLPWWSSGEELACQTCGPRRKEGALLLPWGWGGGGWWDGGSRGRGDIRIPMVNSC